MTAPNNSGKIILDLCGGTGAWSRPYRDAGYDVRLITLPDNDVLTYEPPENVYGILAAPPCTEFSQALNGRRKRDIPGALEIVNACMRIIQHCAVYGNLKFWALENPAGLLSPAPLAKFLGRPHYSFEQWKFGGDKGKLTYIWGYFREPAFTVTERPQFEKECHAHAPGWTKPIVPKWCTDYISQFKGDAKRAALRAITPPGFAEAFWRANK